MLSRKVYEVQAAIIKKHLPTAGPDACYDIATDIANYFANDNPRFDRTRFFEACGLDGLHLRTLPVENEACLMYVDGV